MKISGGFFIFVRPIDLFLAIIGLLFCSPLFLLIFFAGILDTGSPLFIQQRVGMRGQVFRLVKFRTMNRGTASVATHLAGAEAVTPLGRILRKTKLDELPQLWNVLKGDMSLVGPRPCLPSQTELLEFRRRLGVLSVRPGITGLAQVKGIDMSTPELLAETDAAMIRNISLTQYFSYIFMTLSGKGSGDRVRTS